MSQIEIKVPDIGNAKDVEIIEVMVKVGDVITKDQSLITLESDKASMEIPSSEAGTIKEMKVALGQRVSKGSVILILEAQGAAAQSAPAAEKPAPVPEKKEAIETTSVSQSKEESKEEPKHISAEGIHAGPSVRRLARELGLDLAQISPTGPKSRILKEDLLLALKGSSGPSMAPAMPDIDFTQFGSVEKQALSRIKKISGQFLHRNWVGIPHVTQFDEADITELEAFRLNAKEQGMKLTPLVFLMKAVVGALKKYPQFNSSLDSKNELWLKQYYHIGVAVDTPNGLVVPVIRNVDQKGLLELANELAQISAKAREKGLSPADMQGGCFTISSLGGIGGTAFTPIINAPEVAILGVSKSSLKPIYQGGNFVPRLMLPLSLSYDHRVIDGAQAARFIVYLSEQLADVRRMLL